MKFIVILMTLFSQYVFSSSFQECEFNIKILEVGEEKIKINSIQVVGEKINQKNCKKFLGIHTITNRQIKSDHRLLKTNATFLGKRMDYSGLGPNGIVSSFSWTFKSLK